MDLKCAEDVMLTTFEDMMRSVATSTREKALLCEVLFNVVVVGWCVCLRLQNLLVHPGNLTSTRAGSKQIFQRRGDEPVWYIVFSTSSCPSEIDSAFARGNWRQVFRLCRRFNERKQASFRQSHQRTGSL